MSAGEVVAALIKANEARDLDAIVALMTEDIAYENVGMGVCNGADEVRALLGPFYAGAEKVDVSAVVPLLRTDTSSLGAVIDTRQIQGLPLDGRNFYELSLLLPGVTTALRNGARRRCPC